MPPKKIHPDNLDYQIIRELHSNTRSFFSEISRKTSYDELTIRKGIDRIIDDSVFRLKTILDPEAFGYMTAVDIFLFADPDHEKVILAVLIHMPEISYAAFGPGSTVISVKDRLENYDNLREFIQHKLPDLPGGKVTDYVPVPRILMNGYLKKMTLALRAKNKRQKGIPGTSTMD